MRSLPISCNKPSLILHSPLISCSVTTCWASPIFRTESCRTTSESDPKIDSLKRSKLLGAAEPRYVLHSPGLVENCMRLYVPLLEFNLLLLPRTKVRTVGCLRFRYSSSHDLKPVDRLRVHELSAVNGHRLRFKCRATAVFGSVAPKTPS